jgi:hypothetical protein
MTSSPLYCIRQPAAAPRARRAPAFYLCRAGARKRVALAYTLVSVAIAAGCNFTDFSKTQPIAVPDAGPVTEPACLPNPIEDAGPKVEPIAHWTFDRTAPNEQWLDERGVYPLVPSTYDSAADATPATTVLYPRINGGGQSLLLDGHQYARVVRADAADPFLDRLEEFTVAAWVSLPASLFTSKGRYPSPEAPTSLSPVPFKWPIVSTLDDGAVCTGYQLDLRFDGPPAKPELVLSYQAQVAGDASVSACKLLSLHAPLDVPSWATGVGRWHQVAGTRKKVGEAKYQLALFWDGAEIRLQDPLAPLTPEDSAVSSTGDPALYIGAAAPGAPSDAKAKFPRYIDEVAIFATPLNERQLHDFVLASTTRPGPSNCRWRASEQWDETASKDSHTDWSPDSTPEALSVVMLDNDWGAGALDARIEPPRDIQLYKWAHLVGYFPEGLGLQFTLASGDNYCTWVYFGKGNKSDKYDIDLTNPINCVSTTCAIDFHRIDRASITSEWAVPFAAEATRPPGQTEHFVMRRLEFEPANGAVPDWTSYGGVIGPMGYCWRLQAYEPEGIPEWDQAATPSWPDPLAVKLYGLKNSGTRVVADFADRPLDISNCESVAITAKLEPSPDGNPYSFAIQDVYGSWRSYDLSPNSGTQEYSVSLVALAGSSSDHFSTQVTTPNFNNFPSKLDLSKVRLLGFQKPWVDNGWRAVTVQSVQFAGSSGYGCQDAGVN